LDGTVSVIQKSSELIETTSSAPRPADVKDLGLSPNYRWLAEILTEDIHPDANGGETLEIPRHFSAIIPCTAKHVPTFTLILWFAKTLADFEINDIPCRSQKLRDPEFRRVTMLQASSHCLSFQTHFEFWRRTGYRESLRDLIRVPDGGRASTPYRCFPKGKQATYEALVALPALVSNGFGESASRA